MISRAMEIKGKNPPATISDADSDIASAACVRDSAPNTDALTKPLSRQHFLELRVKLNIVQPTLSLRGHIRHTQDPKEFAHEGKLSIIKDAQDSNEAAHARKLSIRDTQDPSEIAHVVKLSIPSKDYG